LHDCATADSRCVSTILTDLRLGRDKLLAAIDSKTRYGIRAAEKAKVVVEQTRSVADISRFFELCDALSKAKDFSLPASEALMLALCATPADGACEARLFAARVDGKLAAGAMILRCGRSLHYFWGAMDRSFVKQHPSEAIQWAVIQWGVENSFETYDLEGVDLVNNPGTAQFKLKLGAKELPLPGPLAYPLGLVGRAALWVAKPLGRLR
jgi:lipid II:glycine glycyltransferase (peptidoglycan interpeptide bridge formation enzyme)